jgi:hypothetical protein
LPRLPSLNHIAGVLQIKLPRDFQSSPIPAQLVEPAAQHP